MGDVYRAREIIALSAEKIGDGAAPEAPRDHIVNVLTRQRPKAGSLPAAETCLSKNTRTPVSLVFDNLEAGMTIEEITEQYAVTREQINVALEFAARSAAPPPPSRTKVLTP